MSETETSIVRDGDGGESARESVREPHFVLPRWAIEITRVVLRAAFTLLWGLRARGVENIPLDGGLIIAANHQTYIDPFWIAVPIRRYLRYLAWDEIFGWPIVGRLTRWLGAWPLQIERGDPRAIRRSLQWLRRGGAFVIFPEGGRALSDGEMMRFKTGAARMALEAGVPVLPVTVRGGDNVWPRGWRFPRLGAVELVFHPILHLTQLPGESVRESARRESDKLAEIIRSAL